MIARPRTSIALFRDDGVLLSGSGEAASAFTPQRSSAMFQNRLAGRSQLPDHLPQFNPGAGIQACRRFVYTENLLPEAEASTPEQGRSPKSLEPASAAVPIPAAVCPKI